MNYLGFARKYRPKTFEEVVGQQEIAHTLQNAITTNRIHHAYLFCGSKGVGKTSMARIFAKALNCQKGTSIFPCQECEICQRVSTGDDVDVIEIDGASNRGIEEIRNIKDNIKYLPSRARFKIFIIDEIHMLTTAAFNALLKTLEEPPAHVKFIFATTQIHSIPDTILSRCQRFSFKKMEIHDVVEQLKHIAKEEKLEAEEEVFEKIAQRTNGAMRDSLVLLDQLAAYNSQKITIHSLQAIHGSEGEESSKIIHAIAEKNVIVLLSTIADFFGSGGNVENLMENLIQKFRDLLVFHVTGGAESFIEGTLEYQKWLLEKKAFFSQEFLHCAIYQLIEAKNLVHRSLLGKIILETVLLKILNTDSLVSLKTIEKKLYDLQEKISSKNPSASFSTRPLTPSHFANFAQEVVPPSAVSVGLKEGKKNSEVSELNAQGNLQALTNKPTHAIPLNQATEFYSAQPVVPEVMTKQEIPAQALVLEKMVKQEAAMPVDAALKEKPAIKQESIAQEKPVSPKIPRQEPGIPEKPLFPSNSSASSVATQQWKPAIETIPVIQPWEKFVEGIKKLSPSMGDFLQKNAQFELQEDTLVIIIPKTQSIVAQTMSSPKNKKNVSDCILASFQKPLAVRFSYSGEEKAVEYKEYQKSLPKDPMISKALELFEARVLEIQKL
ncbi:MAG: DNA polymerase III subunit gamma/tau [Candidatus Brocadiae bacterium]|nr:DNA polymerase III subunit gamma/tau [Candidatus Brocadiia bacterium]